VYKRKVGYPYVCPPRGDGLIELQIEVLAKPQQIVTVSMGLPPRFMLCFDLVAASSITLKALTNS